MQDSRFEVMPFVATERVVAFAWTCAVELPVYAAWLRTSGIGATRAVVTIIALQLATHPLLWTIVSHATHYVPTAIAAELVAVVVEGALFYGLLRRHAARPLAISRALAASLTANAASVAFGLALGPWLYGDFTGPK